VTDKYPAQTRWRKNNPDYWRNNFADHPDRRKKKLSQMREWRRINPGYRKNEKYRAQHAEDVRKYRGTPEGRLVHNMRTRVCRAVKRLKKSDSTMRLVGCSLDELKAWLSGWFQPGMTWDNYGRAWHIDHNRPCASFDLSLPENQRRCFHYLNLRPLFAADNLRKGDKFPVSRGILVAPKIEGPKV
jgi:hypothetical protein